MKEGLLSLPSSVATTSPSSSTIALPSTSPLGTLSTSFESRGVNNEFFQPEPLLTSTPDLTLLPQYHNLSSLPSPAPSHIYSISAPQNRSVGVSPPRFALASPLSHEEYRPIRQMPRTSPLFAAPPPQLVVPRPRETTVIRLPTQPVSRAALVGYAPPANCNTWIDPEPRFNRPYPDRVLFTNTLRKAISKISPLLVFYESQGETLFNESAIRNLYKSNLNEICNLIQTEIPCFEI